MKRSRAPRVLLYALVAAAAVCAVVVWCLWGVREVGFVDGPDVLTSR